MTGSTTTEGSGAGSASVTGAGTSDSGALLSMATEATTDEAEPFSESTAGEEAGVEVDDRLAVKEVLRPVRADGILLPMMLASLL